MDGFNDHPYIEQHFVDSSVEKQIDDLPTSNELDLTDPDILAALKLLKVDDPEEYNQIVSQLEDGKLYSADEYELYS